MSGVLSAGLPKSAASLIRKEEEALRHAMDHAIAGDIIVIFYEKLESLMKIINEETSKRVRVKERESSEITLAKA